MQVSRQYHFDFDHPVDRLWALVSDTPRWGEASGFPKYQASEVLQSDGRVKVFGQAVIAGFNISWEEPPSDWIAERWFEQRRLFSRGPIRSMTTNARLEDRGDRSGLDIELHFDSKNPIGSLLAGRMVAAYQGKVAELLAQADQLIRAEKPELFATAYQPGPAALQRTENLQQRIDESSYGHGLAAALVDYINEHQEVDL